MHRLHRALTLRLQIAAVRAYVPRQTFTIPKSRYSTSTIARPVRIRRPGWSYRRLIKYVVFTGAIYAYFSMIVKYTGVSFEIIEDDGEYNEEGNEEEGEAVSGPPYYAEEDSWFIPLTWSTKLPRAWYRGSDPEWQEFIKLAKDKPRMKKIHEELVQTVFGNVKSHPLLSRSLGNNPKVKRYWLDISFPDGPPPEYERSGIEIGEDFIAWSQQKVSQEDQKRLERALFPKAVMDSVWAMSKVTLEMQYKRALRALGRSEGDEIGPMERYQQVVDIANKQKQQEQGRVKSTFDSKSNDGDTSTAQPTTTEPARVQSDQAKKLPLGLSVPMPWSNTSSNSAAAPPDGIGLHVFRSTLARSWNPKTMEPPRGTFVVMGMIEIHGAHGRFLIDVVSCYDPSSGKFVNLKAGLKNFKKWNQRPKGGP